MILLKLYQLHCYLKNDTSNILILNYLMSGYFISLLFSYSLDNFFMILIVLIFLFNENMKERLLFALKHKIVQASILIFAIVVAWSCCVEDFILALYHIKSYRHFLYAIIFVAIIDRKFLENFLFIFLISLFLHTIYFSLMHFNIVDSPFKVVNDFPFLTKMEHALLVLVALGLSLYKILMNETKKYIIIFLLLFFILETFNIFLSGSRTAILLYGIVIMVTFLFVFRKRILQAFLISSILSALLITIAILFTPVKSDLDRAYENIIKSYEVKDYNSSSGARIGMSLYAFYVWEENILFGIGTGEHLKRIKSKIEESISDNPDINLNNEFSHVLDILEAGRLTSIHNTYLELLVQFGMVGVFVFVIYFYTVISSFKKMKPEHYFFVLLFTILLLISMIPGMLLSGNINVPKIYVLIVSVFLSSCFEKKNIQKFK